MKFWKNVSVFLLVVGVGVGVILGIRLHFTQLWRGYEGASEIKEERQNTGLPLKFAVMGDIHSDWGNLRKGVQKAKEDQVEFIIIVGDLTTIGEKSELLEAKKILDESGLKYYVIPGNHDIWLGRKFKKEDIWGEVFGESFKSFSIDSEMPASPNRGEQRFRETKFILVNNGDGINGLDGTFGTKGKQRKWIEKEVEECLKIYCLVFMHEPLNHPNSLHLMGEENPKVASEAGELVKLFVRNQVREVFAGHLHFSSSYELEGLKTTIVGAVTSERNFQSPKFLEVWQEDGRLERKEVFIFE